MREILFRGKRIDNAEWIYGGYFKEPYTDKAYIICWNSMGLSYNEFIEVDSETIGQYTGLTDKNGKKIFEGDILQYCGKKYAVTFKDGSFECDGFYDCYMDCPGYAFSEGSWRFEVIGNIYDNPELLEVTC